MTWRKQSALGKNLNHNLFPKHSTLMAHHQVKAGNSMSVKLNSCRPHSSSPCPPMSPMSQCDSPVQFQLEQDFSADTSSQRDPQGCPMTGTGTAQQHCNLNTTARGGKPRTTLAWLCPSQMDQLTHAWGKASIPPLTLR